MYENISIRLSRLTVFPDSLFASSLSTSAPASFLIAGIDIVAVAVVPEPEFEVAAPKNAMTENETRWKTERTSGVGGGGGGESSASSYL